MKILKCAFFAAFILLMLSGNIAIAALQQQTIVRTISYDPHPASAEFAQQAPFKGKLMQIAVAFKENWKTVRDTAYLQDITISLTSKGKGGDAGSVSSNKILTEKVKKGQLLETIKMGELSLEISVEDLVKAKGGVTDLTLTFKLIYPEEAMQAAAAIDAENQSSGALSLAQKLAQKAMAMPDSNPKAKAALLRRALSAAPAANTSVAAEKFHDEINATIMDIESHIPDGPSSVAPARPSSSESTKVPTQQISPEAKDLLKHARAMFAQEKGPEAREALRKALEMHPDFYDALIMLADNAYQNRKYARAKESYDKALEINDRDPEVQLNLFKARYYMGEGAEAVESFQQVSNRYPKDTLLKLNLSEAYFQLGDLPSAQAICQHVLEQNPNNYRAKDLLQRIGKLMK